MFLLFSLAAFNALSNLFSLSHFFTGLYQSFYDEDRVLTGEAALIADAALSEDDSADDDNEIFTAAAAADPLFIHQRTMTGMLVQEDSDSVLSNKTGLQATFMTTQIAPCGLRASTSIAIRTLQSTFLFECGEDTQRSLLGHPIIDWKRIERIFVSSMTPEAVLGVPGMLCTISASRERGHEAADFPVHVYGPPGLVSFVSSMLAVSKTYLEMPVILHEFTPRAVPAEQLDQPTEVLRRARLYAVAVPPDQLNPDGYYDGQLSAMLARHTRKKSSAGVDSRSGTLPQNLPPPGNPALAGKIPVTEMTWTVRIDGEYTIKAAPLKSKVPTLGYLIAEANRSGRLYPDVAAALGVTNRDCFTDLKEGRSVIGDNGQEVKPEQCVGPPRPGRRLALVPPCGDSTSFAAAIGQADLLIHSMVPPEGVSVDTAEKAAEMAGKCAAAMKCCEVVLWQPLISFLDSNEATDEEFPLRAIATAKEAFGKEFVSLGGTFRVHQWERDEGPRVPTELPKELMHLVPEDS